MPDGAKRLKNKVCVVTGAASAVAEAVADRLTSEGATVVGVDQRQHGVGPHSRTADLTDEDQVRELFASVKNDLGRIDVLYNNAGLNDREGHSALDMPLPVWERVLAANLTKTFLCCKHAIPHLLNNDPPSGSVINTASFLAVMGAASSQMAYSVAKAGILQLSRDLGVHLGRRGVRVNALVLGPIETPSCGRSSRTSATMRSPGASCIIRWAASARWRSLPARWRTSPAMTPASSPAQPFHWTAASRQLYGSVLSDGRR
jgi:NAD(P)-dependent dehydrogenase (short-subunit alcohol dehydrogenase family)